MTQDVGLDSNMLDGRKICDDIKTRIRAVNAKRVIIPRLTLISLCRLAHVSIYTFRSWRMGRNPSFDSLKKLYAVLDRYESGAEDLTRE